MTADARLDEMSAERVHPELLRLLVLRGVDGRRCADRRDIAVVVSKLPRRGDDGAAPRADTRRSALDRCDRKLGVADLQIDCVKLAAQGVGGYLGQRRPCARADVD